VSLQETTSVLEAAARPLAVMPIRPRPARSGRAWLGMLALAAASFWLHLGVAQGFEARRALSKSNVLFNADPNMFLRAFSVGWADPRIKHPNLANFVAPAVRMSAKAISSLTGLPELAVREKLAFGVTPLFSAAGTALLFDIAIILGIGAPGAAALCLLDLAAGSGVIFGGIAESFPLSGFGLAWMFWLAARRTRGRRVPRWEWLACGVFVTGVTVTNIVPFAILWLCLEWRGRGRWPETARSTAKLTAGVAAATAMIWMICFATIRMTMADEVELASRVSREERATGSEDLAARLALLTMAEKKYLRADPLPRMLGFPVAVTDSLMPPAEPRIVSHTSEAHEPDGPSIMFTFDGAGGRPLFSVVLTMATAALLICGLAGWLVRAAGRAVGAACIGILGYHLALHSIFGDEFFVYSQHWQLVAVMLAAGVLLRAQTRLRNTALVAAMAAIAAVNSYYLVTFLYRALDREGLGC
jgi:hypothetical protein